MDLEEKSVKQLFSDQLREWADEGVGRIEKEAREDFAELLKEWMRNHPHTHIWRGEVEEMIDGMLEECEED